MIPTPSSTMLLPAKRPVLSDIADPVFGDLVDLALLRVFDAIVPFQNRPSRLFPTAETVFGDYFTCDDWLLHGDLETELGRMSYMLSRLPERGIPARCLSTVRLILSFGSVLTGWESHFGEIAAQTFQETESMVHRMRRSKQNRDANLRKPDLIAIPVDYETRPAASIYASRLWHRALEETTRDLAVLQMDRCRTFLQIFAFLKDPLGGLPSVSTKAVDVFVHLITAMATTLRPPREATPTEPGWHAAVAQAAQEALFLASPLLERIDYIHFAAHQQLPYVYVRLDELPRSEFSIPEHTVRIVEEIMTSGETDGQCCIAPICVSSYPELPLEQGRMTTVIIDGNHRATATMVLRLIAEHPSVVRNKDHCRDALAMFCRDHGLGRKWEMDLAETIEVLHQRASCVSLIRSKFDLVKRFRGVDLIPALVVREDNFHTACQQRAPLADRPRLLLPIHQAIYNDEGLQCAFPQAGQVHGRAVGFKPMPLFRVGGRDKMERHVGGKMGVRVTIEEVELAV